MKKLLLGISLLFATLVVNAEEVTSPSGQLKLEFSLNEKGVPTYRITYKGIAVVNPSTLGICLLYTSRCV